MKTLKFKLTMLDVSLFINFELLMSLDECFIFSDVFRHCYR